MVIERMLPGTFSKEVLYIGSAVPLETSEGLEAVQQPLRSRYPIDNDDNIKGILSSLTILHEGIQLRYTNDSSHVVLFPFPALTMCAAVRCVKTVNVATNEMTARFVSLSSPEAADGVNSDRPAIFTAITRRTKGRQVLECHGFITITPKDAMELVQWTSAMDKRSKQRGYATLSTAMNSSTYDVSRAADTSFTAETNSLLPPEFPIQLVPGEPVLPNTSAAFYKEPPSNGYFYCTKNAQVKTYSLQKFSGSAAIDETPSVISPPGLDHFERKSGYAVSHSSATVFPQSILTPIRPYRPAPVYMRPVIMAPPPVYSRPRFFSPPPPQPILRMRPVPVFIPPPSALSDSEFHVRRPTHRTGSRGSSATSSASSDLDSPRVNGKPPRKGLGQTYQGREDSSELSSRPRTPPTDYDVPKGPRISRREQFYMQEPTDSPRGFRGGYYLMPPYSHYGVATLDRPRSVPPYMDREVTQRKDKKSKKAKKSKKSGKRRVYADLHDESTDSVGYMSELADNRQPRDFRRLENQFKHERAFSKSLAEETRHSLRRDRPYNAYVLNNTSGGNENDFPTLH